MPKDKTIKEEIAKQDKDIYGDETISGTDPSPDSDDDVEEIMEDAFGKDASDKSFEKHKPFDIDEEIENDEWKASGFTVKSNNEKKKDK
jgi:hypothetical protein